MVAEQLSIFLENKRGRFTEVAKILGEAGVNMTAFTVSENTEFGILRLIVSDTQRATQVLQAHSYGFSLTKVVCLQCRNEPGALGKLMEKISKKGIFVEYMYAFAEGDKANIVIRPDNLEACKDIADGEAPL
jgi:hypothetical protein